MFCIDTYVYCICCNIIYSMMCSIIVQHIESTPINLKSFSLKNSVVGEILGSLEDLWIIQSENGLDLDIPNL